MDNKEFIWSTSKRIKIKLGTIKEFTVSPSNIYYNRWVAQAWTSKNDWYEVYEADSEELVQLWIDDLTS